MGSHNRCVECGTTVVRLKGETCRRCDAASAPCSGCATPISTYKGREFCSRRCIAWRRSHPDGELRPLAITCEQCGTEVEYHKGRRYCSIDCRRAAGYQAEADRGRAPRRWTEARKAAYQRRRAAKKSTEVEKFAAEEIYERDSWVCQLCKGRVSKALVYPHRMSASLDHIVPLSEHGGHVRENVQLAHLKCNVAKGASPANEQLRLVG